MCGIDADLTVVPVMRVPGGAQNARRHRGEHAQSAAQKPRLLAAADIFCLLREDMDRMLFRACDIQTERVDQAALADREGLFRDILERHALDEAGCLLGDRRTLGHFGKGILHYGHRYSPVRFVRFRVSQIQTGPAKALAAMPRTAWKAATSATSW